jgi:hypothetical protein
MLGTVKPIETCYRGYKCRSRLEARWMVFFDAMNIRFEYEPEGFQSADGQRYLPDFRLVDIDTYVEVKPESIESKDLLRCQKFVMDGMSQKILILVGHPDFKAYTLFRRIDLPDQNESWLTNACLDIYGVKNIWYFKEHRLYEVFPDEEFAHEYDFSDEYKAAVKRARAARFDERERTPSPWDEYLAAYRELA